MITISAVADAPPFARGQVRDLRVRWALEEAGIPYEVERLENADRETPDYRALQPFGQVPVMKDGDVTLFESGAIILYIGERCPDLLPTDPVRRAKATQWLIAALSSVEPFIVQVARIDIFHADEPWAQARRPEASEVMHRRLAALAAALGDKPYLDGDAFTAGDLMMTTVLRIKPEETEKHSVLAGYVERCTARPAFGRALISQLEDYRAN